MLTAHAPLAHANETASSLSVLGQRWVVRECDPMAAYALCQTHGVTEVIGRILAARGVTLEEAGRFLSPTLRELLPDPFHLKDMEKAARRIAEEVVARCTLQVAENHLQPTIAIFGDYDVDGATSSALLVRYFRALGIEPLVHIPDRMKEGYGPNLPALLALKDKGARLVITVDCGTMAFEPLAGAAEAGLEVIVLDHHKGEMRLPDAYAVVNPNRADETSPHGQLAAVGVTFLTLVAVNRMLRERGIEPPDLMRWLDLVALGTICDVVPLTGANRALVTQGLKIMARRSNPGIAAAMDAAKLDETPGAYHAGFIIGPRINAGGRVGQADMGIRLLAADDALEARELAEALDRFNSERKAIEALVLEEAMQDAAARPATDAVTVVAREGWHPGVIGIVAGRLKEHFHKPAAVIALDKGTGKASARSISGVDLGAAVITAVQSGVLPGGGGHAMAAGFSVHADSIQALRDFFNARLGQQVAMLAGERRLHLDSAVGLAGLTSSFLQELERLGPFGAGNPSIRLMLKGVRVVHADMVGSDHVRVVVCDAGPVSSKASLKCIAFRSAGTPLGQMLLNARGRTLHLAGQAKLNRWQGRESVEFFVDDAMVL